MQRLEQAIEERRNLIRQNRVLMTDVRALRTKLILRIAMLHESIGTQHPTLDSSKPN